jgi:hypothetical protein
MCKPVDQRQTEEIQGYTTFFLSFRKRHAHLTSKRDIGCERIGDFVFITEVIPRLPVFRSTIEMSILCRATCASILKLHLLAAMCTQNDHETRA